MSEIQFTRPAGETLYWLDLSGVLPPGSTYAIGYQLVGPGLPDTLTLTQTWSDHPSGIYLFLKSKPASADLASFVSNLEAFLSAVSEPDVRFLWVENPSDPYPKWRYGTLAARQEGAGFKVARLAQLELVNYALLIGGGCSITLVADPPVGQPAGFRFAAVPGLSSSLRFTSGSGAYFYDEQTGQVFLSLSGAIAGTFAFQILLSANQDQPDQPFAQIDAGLRYFVDDDRFPGSDLLSSLRFPVLVPTADVTLYGVLDPLNPLDPTRSFLSLAPATGPMPAAMPSGFRTSLGGAITLAPYRADDGSTSSRLVFARRPEGKAPDDEAPYSLTYEGPWQVNMPPDGDGTADGHSPVTTLMPGASGLEYLGVMTTGQYFLYFSSGKPAYARAYVPPGRTAGGVQSTNPILLDSLNGAAMTSWIYLSSAGNDSVYYYAQPDGAELYHGGSSSQFLELLEVPAAVLPASAPSASTAVAFPGVPFSALQENDLAPYRQLEIQVLSPKRRAVIRGIEPATTPIIQAPAPTRMVRGPAPQPIPPPPPPVGMAQTGVTPQGLFATFSSDLLQWTTLTLAQTPRTIDGTPPQRIQQTLDFKNITGPLKAALQSNQLFLVLSDPTEVLKFMSVTFRMTPDRFGELAALRDKNGQPVIPQRVLNALTSHGIVNTFYADKDAYEAALQSALDPSDFDNQEYQRLLLQYGAFADLNIGDWTFHVSPYEWHWSELNNTIVLFKYAGRTLMDLVNDLGAWAWLDGAGGAAAPLTQAKVRAILQGAIDAGAGGQDEFNDLARIAQSAAWNGILFLNVPFVPVELPEQLQGLAAGIDRKKFFVHHLGINVSPIEVVSGQPQLANSTLFGLINYRDEDDLYFTGPDYDFKVLRLAILFLNSQIERFTSSVEVQINKLFGEDSTLLLTDHGNNIVLRGVYQQHDGKSSYVFVEQDDNIFEMTSQVLDVVDIRKAQFFTVVPDDPAANRGAVRTRFLFSGVIRFLAIEGFDVFAYGSAEGFTGGLVFQNLVLEMNFQQSAPQDREFVFRADAISVDLATSAARPGSLVSHFPLTFRGFLEGTPDKTPGDLGYMAVTSPLRNSRMDPPWYALVWNLDLGTLGALAASAGLVVALIAAWSAAGETRNVYIGLRLPGSVGAQTRIPIEGILNLDFKKIELVVQPPRAPPPEGIAAGTQYMLKLRGVSLSLLTLSFPPGDVDVYLFGNPATGDASLLGWYAAYVKGE